MINMVNTDKIVEIFGEVLLDIVGVIIDILFAVIFIFLDEIIDWTQNNFAIVILLAFLIPAFLVSLKQLGNI